MSNYGYIERLLHNFYLSNNFIKKVSFDLEKSLFLEYNDNLITKNHIFLTGMPRSGTTTLLNFLFKTEDFASLKYSDMPLILCPNIWNKFNFFFKETSRVERNHGDNILFSSDSEEAFEEVFWKLFENYKEDEKYKEYVNYILIILRKYNKVRYLSKNNLSYKRVKSLTKIFPNSTFIVPFRSPLLQSNSLLNQHERFYEMQQKDTFILKYMDFLGHNEFGIHYIPWNVSIKYQEFFDLNHWLEQWLLFYKEVLKLNSVKNLIFLSYEEICNDPNLSKKLTEKLEVRFHANFFKMSNKKVIIDYDEALLNKCELIYNKLLKISFK